MTDQEVFAALRVMARTHRPPVTLENALHKHVQALAALQGTIDDDLYGKLVDVGVMLCGVYDRSSTEQAHPLHALLQSTDKPAATPEGL
ncbi:hypothetical protein AWB80_01672 [Caballeronia pedi]|uniref:Uncharacterized protein n=1 Tax=Caballeronia pedi TaxID=1777141 RepID=A0A158A1C7_9BURK|nr:hypothetical protein [Caballeronia pedi]SAK51622.1 hypothetical protein AWB80_01672 [Caballeronia pedi]